MPFWDICPRTLPPAPGALSRETSVFLATFRKGSSPTYLRVLEGHLGSGTLVSLGHPDLMNGGRCCWPARRAQEESRTLPDGAG